MEKKYSFAALSIALTAALWPGADAIVDLQPAAGALARREELAAIRARFTANLERTLLVDQTGTSYDQKQAIALLPPPLADDAARATALAAHRVYLDEVLTADTRHLGESTVREDCDGDGAPEWRNITATPHIWAQTLIYLSLLAADDSAHLAQPALPSAAEPADATVGCARAAVPGAPVPGAAATAIFGLMVVGFGWRRWRRHD